MPRNTHLPADPSMAATPVLGRDPLLPPAQGLYDPAKEHNSCGVGFVAKLDNQASHEIVEMGLQILLNLDHRGAVGADPKLGDGCGILVQIPHGFFKEEVRKLGVTLPAPQDYAIGQFFLPRDADMRERARDIVAAAMQREGLTLLGWRDLPIDFERSRRRRARGRAASCAALRRSRRGREK